VVMGSNPVWCTIQIKGLGENLGPFVFHVSKMCPFCAHPNRHSECIDTILTSALIWWALVGTNGLYKL